MTSFSTLCLWLALLLALLATTARAQSSWTWAAATSSLNDDAGGITAVVNDAAGNTIVAGNFSGTITLGPLTLTATGTNHDSFVAWLDAGGTWTRVVQAGGGSGYGGISTMTIAPSGELVVTGSFQGSFRIGATVLTAIGFNDAFVARLSASGTWGVVTQLGSPFATAFTTGLKLDAVGNAVVLGAFIGSLQVGSTLLTSSSNNTYDVFVARLNPANVWFQAASGGGTGQDAAYALALDASGNPVIAGYFSNTATFGPYTLTSNSGSGLFVARLNAAGAWTQAVQTSGSGGRAYANAVAVDGQGNAVVAGELAATTAFGTTTLDASSASSFVAWLSPAGTWVRAAGGGGVAAAVATDSQSNVVVAGRIFSNGTDPAVFGNISLTLPGNAAYVARLTASGTWTSVLTAGTSPSNGRADPYRLVLDERGVATVAGSLSNAVRFGTTTLTNNRPQYVAGYVARVGGSSLAALAAVTAAFALSPNPANDQVRLSGPAAALPRLVLLTDCLGQLVRRVVVPAQATIADLNLTGLAPGLYVVHCAGAAQRLVVQ